MQQTPAHSSHNQDLLDLVPQTATKIIEVGCSTGALAKACKERNHHCHYLGIEIDPDYAREANNICDACLIGDIESFDSEFWTSNSDRDCWIFGDCLEHLRDPWLVLSQIRKVIPQDGCVVACIPNAQHWSVQLRINAGEFRYEDSGLFDRTHLRWFTRQTIIELFQQTGFQIAEGKSRIFEETNRDRFIPLLGQLARESGADPEAAMRDATPLQFVIRANPI